jgi:hypothetical protein
MVSSESVQIVIPSVKRNVPGGGSLFWRIWSRATLLSVGLASKGFLKLQRNVKVEGLNEFLKVLESKRNRSVITGISGSVYGLCGSV